MKFELVLPHLPPSELMPNKLRSLHWAVRSKIQETARAEACKEAQSALAKGIWRLPQLAWVKYLFYTDNKREIDVDNLIGASKAYLDGLKDAGVIWKDHGFYLWCKGGELRHSTQNVTKLIIEERAGE